MTTEVETRRRRTPDVTDLVLFLRLYEMLDDVGRELRNQKLDGPARRRAALLLAEARSRLRDALSPDAAAEFERLEPGLSADPAEVELRLAYQGTLAWLAGLGYLAVDRLPGNGGGRRAGRATRPGHPRDRRTDDTRQGMLGS